MPGRADFRWPQGLSGCWQQGVLALKGREWVDQGGRAAGLLLPHTCTRARAHTHAHTHALTNAGAHPSWNPVKPE